jgi:adenylosuccinate lyase
MDDGQTLRSMVRDDAYRVVQRNAMAAWEDGQDFRMLLEADPDMALGKEALDEAFDLERSLRNLDRVSAALDEIRPSD